MTASTESSTEELIGFRRVECNKTKSNRRQGRAQEEIKPILSQSEEKREEEISDWSSQILQFEPGLQETVEPLFSLTSSDAGGKITGHTRARGSLFHQICICTIRIAPHLSLYSLCMWT